MKQKSAINAVARAFDGRRRLRGWSNTHFGGMEAVKVHPLQICRFRPDEGGTVSTNLNLKLAPVSGFMRSKAYVDVIQVWVPYQAIEKLEYPQNYDAGVTEMTKRRLLQNTAPPLETENEITKAANIHPRSVGGHKRVCRTARLAYLAANNHLRKVAYYNAQQLDRTAQGIQPAILTANILDRFKGVLDPERLIDGAINLTGQLPVKGIGPVTATPAVTPGQTITETGGTTDGPTDVNQATGANLPYMKIVNNEPQIFVDMEGASELTLRDMVQSQKLDGLIRQFAKLIEDDPINGEEVVERALYGLTVDYDHNCHVLYRRVHELTAMHERPTDGASINDVSAHFELNTSFATLVPRAELGGQLVTLVSVKPVETLAQQPDPAQTETWQLINRIHDETQLDEVMLKRSDLESAVDAADEDQDAFWVGHNALAHSYITQGPNAQQVFQTEMKSSMWTYEIPTSVTPANVLYPEGGISMYPFFNWNGAHAEYTCSQVAAISTSLAKGPTPVERIQLFADDPTLVVE